MWYDKYLFPEWKKNFLSKQLLYVAFGIFLRNWFFFFMDTIL